MASTKYEAIEDALDRLRKEPQRAHHWILVSLFDLAFERGYGEGYEEAFDEGFKQAREAAADIVLSLSGRDLAGGVLTARAIEKMEPSDA